VALPVYCTVEDVKRALDQKETARNDAQLWRAVDSASRLVENDCHRKFYPTTGTRYFDWPDVSSPTPWRLWLEENEVTAVMAVTAGSTTISTADVYLEPANLGPPYTALELNRGRSVSFAYGTTPQRAVAVTGTFGYCDTTEAAGTLTAAISTTSATTCTVSNGAAVGTGDTIKVDSERMLVTARTMTSTGQTLQTPLTASVANVAVAVTDGTQYAAGEVLLLDSERMLVVDVAGNTLTVKRSWDGTVLATHAGSTIYAARQLTVTRGLTGTTAATHSNAAAVYRQTVPGPVRDYTIAVAENAFLQEVSGYARNIIRDDGSAGTSGLSLAKPRTRIFLGGAIPALRLQVVSQYGRVRIAAI
jgi:hypothetical protein